MNIINAQVEVLKEALKNKNTVIYGELLDNVIIGNGNRLYIIPKKECGVDLTNIDSNNVKIMQESTLKNFMNVQSFKDGNVCNFNYNNLNFKNNGENK